MSVLLPLAPHMFYSIFSLSSSRPKSEDALEIVHATEVLDLARELLYYSRYKINRLGLLILTIYTIDKGKAVVRQ